MFVSYGDDKIRNCCLLLRPGSVNSSFTSAEVKSIRAIIADLKSAPKLTDSPINYIYNNEKRQLNIYHDTYKISCEIISSYKNPTDSQIERIKITGILNTGLQMDMKNIEK